MHCSAPLMIEVMIRVIKSYEKQQYWYYNDLKINKLIIIMLTTSVKIKMKISQLTFTCLKSTIETLKKRCENFQS